MKYKPLYVQITKSGHNKTWYQKKVFQVFEVYEDEKRPNVYLLTQKQLKKLKRALHLEVAISKNDCIIVDEPEPMTIVTKPIVRSYATAHIDKELKKLDKWEKIYCKD